MSTKADLLLQAADRIREFISGEAVRLRMPTQPQAQFFGPPLTSAEMLFWLSQNPAKLNHILQYVPEPEPGTSPARVIHGRKSRMRAGDPEAA